jgi:putative ABC transport system substrate-binding protein
VYPAHPLGLTAGVALTIPIRLAAQPAKVPLIGVLVVGEPGSEQFWRLFRDDMQKLGYIDGQSVRYEFRSDQGQIGRLPELAAELVQLKVDVIVTWFTPAALAPSRQLATSRLSWRRPAIRWRRA